MAFEARSRGVALWSEGPGSRWRAGSSRPFDWSGAEVGVRLATLGHGEGSRAGPEAQAHAVCVLGRSKAHLHNLQGDTDIPAEVGRMVRS